MKHIMIDIETLGSDKTTAPMISIAAVKFSLTSYEVDVEGAFSRNITLDSALEYGTPSGATMKWWLGKRVDLLKEMVFDRDAVTTEQALKDLKKWNNTSGMSAWCKGMDFDFGIIDRLLIQTGLPNPLPQFWKRFDVRTFEATAQHFGAKKKDIPFRAGQAHDALADVIQQADLMVAYSKEIKQID